MNRHPLSRLGMQKDQATRAPYSVPELPWYVSRRFRLFVVSFLFCSLIGLIYVFQRSAIYQSRIVLVTVAPSAVDQGSQEADIQHSAIQGNILTSQKLIEATRKQLSMLLSQDIPSAPAIYSMLFFSPVTDTNLVELRAEGEDPEFLPLLLNTLIEQYEQYRHEQIKIETTETYSALNDQLNTLAAKVEQKRDELDNFRNEHDILSVGRDENQVLRRLKGMTDSLNKALEAEVNTKALLQATRTAIDQGRSIVADGDQRILANLEKRAQDLRERLRELDKRYTRAYMARQPDLKTLPEDLAALEEKIADTRNRSRGVALAEIERNYYAARQAAGELQQQVDDYKDTATEFTRRFSEHEALAEELLQRELLYRETQDRLIAIEVKQRDKYPQITVVEKAYQAIRPIWPNYMRDSGIVLLLSFFLGIGTIWLLEFFNRQSVPQPAGLARWSRIYANDSVAPALDYEAHDQLGQPDHRQSLVIESQTIAELGLNDVEKLLDASNKQGQFVIAGLLNGLSLDELTSLSADQVDIEGGQLNISAVASRTIQLSPGFSKRLSNFDDKPLDAVQAESLVTCAAFDSGLAMPGKINAGLIRQTYITYLVRQGLRLLELEAIIGVVQADELAGYAIYLPEGIRKSANEIDLVYPALV